MRRRAASAQASAVGSAAALALLLVPSLAHARLVLRWDAPSGCPSGVAVEAEVARLLGGSIPEDGAPIVADARARALDAGFELTLRTEVEGEHGERALRADRCEELASAAALIVALMIDPEALARAEPEPASTATLAQRLAVPESAVRIESAREVEPPRELVVNGQARTSEQEPAEPGLHALFGAGAVLDVGTLPSASPGIAIEGGLGIPLVDARLRAVFVFPQTAAAELALPGASAELMAFSAGVLACLRPLEEVRALGACADLSAGTVFGNAHGISSPSFGAGFWLAAGGGLALAWQPEPFFDLELSALVLGQIVAPSFEVVVGSPAGERRVVVWESPGVSGRFSLAGHVRF